MSFSKHVIKNTSGLDLHPKVKSFIQKYFKSNRNSPTLLVKKIIPVINNIIADNEMNDKIYNNVLNIIFDFAFAGDRIVDLKKETIVCDDVINQCSYAFPLLKILPRGSSKKTISELKYKFAMAVNPPPKVPVKSTVIMEDVINSFIAANPGHHLVDSKFFDLIINSDSPDTFANNLLGRFITLFKVNDNFPFIKNYLKEAISALLCVSFCFDKMTLDECTIFSNERGNIVIPFPKFPTNDVKNDLRVTSTFIYQLDSFMDTISSQINMIFPVEEPKKDYSVEENKKEDEMWAEVSFNHDGVYYRLSSDCIKKLNDTVKHIKQQ